jgi:ParB-like chromosome segregation protein Spo0J
MKRQLSIEYIAPGKLNPAAYNPRKISPQEFQRLCRSIREFGFIEPAVVRKDGVIIGGHQRVKAAMEVGLEKIPVLRLDVSEERAKALNLALNKISGEWDMPLLKDLLQDLDAGELDIELTGFTRAEVNELFEKVTAGDMEEVDLRQPPKLVWYLIGVPIDKFGQVQKHIAALESAAALSVQSSRDK